TDAAAPASAALLKQAVELHRADRLDEAAAIYRQVLAENPAHADASHLLGLVHFRNKDFDSAIRMIGDAIAHDPDNPIYHGNLGNVLRDAGRVTDGIAEYRRALELHDGYAEIHNNLGHALQGIGRLDEAIEHYRTSIALQFGNYRAHHNLGNALLVSGKSEEAVAALRESAKLNPGFAATWERLGTALQRLGRAADAEASFRRWIALEPDSADAVHALALDLEQQNRIDEAFDCFERAISLRPDFLPPIASALWLAQRMCNWRATALYSEPVLRRAADEPGAVSPFHLFSLPGATRAQLLAVARSHSTQFASRAASPQPMRHDFARFAQSPRIRVGYLSSDLHAHPVAHLAAEIFELHDRERFEAFLLSYGPDDGSAMRKRLVAGCDRFVDLAPLSDERAAQRIRDERIQILVDLKGYTAGDRPRIGALRPAPIQVNWLGYPGSMGADWIDYLIADRYLIPREHEADYSERIVRLPHCYQPNDRKRPGGGSDLTRRACGLSETAFVFCNFNQSYKIEPDIFVAWMRLLKRVPDSVLWLLDENRWAKDNLRNEALRHGVAAERLVFAPIRPLAEHLSRYALADLVVDTFPYTSHTTGSDARWAGCPIVTLVGEVFASRVAASLLENVGLGRLVTHSFSEYEALAFELALDQPRLAAIRDELRGRRDSLPLFDAPCITRALESAYLRMWQRFAKGLAPEGFDVPAA
ncbi:MAG TPA: tetratricopeptide repeat protein, partial [Casimicrobiaceae bacterium]|nr:tetratricopeptide repeat protein [Casimicrobiaceae bacterium]